MNEKQIEVAALAAQAIADARTRADSADLRPLLGAPVSEHFRIIGTRVALVETLQHYRADGTPLVPGDADAYGYHQERLFGRDHYLTCCRLRREKALDFTGYRTEKLETHMLCAKVTGNAIMAANALREVGCPKAQAVNSSTVWMCEI